jgi:hypothetical protein
MSRDACEDAQDKYKAGARVVTSRLRIIQYNLKLRSLGSAVHRELTCPRALCNRDGTPPPGGRTKVVLPRVRNLPTMGETLILVYMKRIGIIQTAPLDEDISCRSDDFKFSKENI